MGSIVALGYLAGAIAILGDAAQRQVQIEPIIKKVINAAGGEERLRQIKAAQWETKGIYNLGGTLHAAIAEETLIQAPNFQSTLWTSDFGDGIPMTNLSVINRDGAWVRRSSDDGKSVNTEPMTADEVVDSLERAHILTLTYNPFSLTEKTLQLNIVHPAGAPRSGLVAIKVSHPKYREVTLYYDKKTGLLRQRDAYEFVGMFPKRQLVQTHFGRHKEVDGITVPLKSISYYNQYPFLHLELVRGKTFNQTLEESRFKKPD